MAGRDAGPPAEDAAPTGRSEEPEPEGAGAAPGGTDAATDAATDARPRRRRRAVATAPFAPVGPAAPATAAPPSRLAAALTFQAPAESVGGPGQQTGARPSDDPAPHRETFADGGREGPVIDGPMVSAAVGDVVLSATTRPRRRRRSAADGSAADGAVIERGNGADGDGSSGAGAAGALAPAPDRDTALGDDLEREDTALGDDVPDADEGDEPRRRRRRGRRGRGRGREDADAEVDVESEGAEGAAGAEDRAEGATEGPARRVTAASGGGSTGDGSTGGVSTDEDGTDEDGADEDGATAEAGQLGADDDSADDGDSRTGTRRRRRRRRRTGSGGDGDGEGDDPPGTVVHVREPRQRQPREPREPREPRGDGDGVRGVAGSTRLEAKRIRRREGRTDARRRPPVLTESEFLARREAVERRMIVRRGGDRTQVAMLEDGVLVEHYVTKSSATSYAGNIYLGKVQNVLTSMEAAFVDIGKGRNAVLYAGEVAAGEGGPVRIEQALKSGQTVLVQVTKDPVGHKGARLTAQVSLPGRFLVYVPEGPMTGISRKLPDTERSRLKAILKRIVPEDAGVIIRTAAEGATEAELTSDVERLQLQWREITAAAASGASKAPVLLHGEPDLLVKTVRDHFNEDIAELVVQGEAAYDEIAAYVGGVAPDLLPRVQRWEGDADVFAALRVDEGLAKALDRKVHLPSGGSLVIDRTEALTAIDVNTGRFTGTGGNLEETVTRNNLEAAEEIVRQLRLRDVGGMVVIDFIDMVLESNRELVLRRLVECLGRDRTKHQVSEVTSLGLVQLTRKRVGQGLLESFSEPCPTCGGRGVVLHPEGYDASAPAPPRPRVPSPSAVAARVSASAAAALGTEQSDIVVEALGTDDDRADIGDRADVGADEPTAAVDADAVAEEPTRAAVAAVAEGPEAGSDTAAALGSPRRRRGARRSASRDPAPTGQPEPGELTEPAEPGELTEPAEPAELTELTEPAELTEPGELDPESALAGTGGPGDGDVADPVREPPPVGAVEAAAEEDDAVQLVPFDAE